MFVTLTSKEQLTLPKEIRDRLNLEAGAIHDFQIRPDNTIAARQGCEFTATFDRGTRKLPGVKVL